MVRDDSMSYWPVEPVEREYPPLPDDHDCEDNDCGIMDRPSVHLTEMGLCLACGGCLDRSCCGGHDYHCYFAPPTKAAVRARETAE